MFARITYILFYILIFSLVLVNPFHIGVFGQRILPTDFLFLLTSLFYALAIFSRQLKFGCGSFYLPALLYLAAVFFSMLFSENVSISAVKFLGSVYLIGLAILSFNLVNSIQIFRKVFKIWLAATFVTSSVSFFSFVLFYLDASNPLLKYTLSHFGSLPPGNYPRIQSTFFNPNMLCHYLNIGWLILLASFYLKWIKFNFFVILLCLLSFASFLTISPGLGGIFLGIGIWLWLIFEKNGKFLPARIGLTGGLFLAFLFFASTIFSPIISATSPYHFSVPIANIRIDPSPRFLTWHSALETFYENPVFGRGIGLDAANVIYRDASGNIQNLTDAHQIWLNIAAQTGLTGAAAFAFLCIFFVRRFLPFEFSGTDDILKAALGTAFISAVLYQGLTGSFEEARHFWVLTGLLASACRTDFPKSFEKG
jgi:putative inorganic carbon (hco3(-)) transporter